MHEQIARTTSTATEKSTTAGADIVALARRLESANGVAEVFQILSSNENLARLYHSIDNGSSRFPLVRDYPFEIFWDALSIASGLKLNSKVISEFQQLLSKTKFTLDEQNQIITNLLNGRHPFYSPNQLSLERKLEIDLTDDTQLEQAYIDAAIVLGAGQLGVCLKLPLYRTYLAQIGDANAKRFLEQLKQPDTLTGKANLLFEIEQTYANFESQIENELIVPWFELSQSLQVSLNVGDVLDHISNTITVRELLASLSTHASKTQSAASYFIEKAIDSLGVSLEEVEKELFKEVHSHLEGAFAEIYSKTESQRLTDDKSNPCIIRLRYLDKKEDLIDCLRFADSKLCCYSTPFYQMHVAHHVPNKVWKIAITQDPLFFIFQLEKLPAGASLDQAGGKRHSSQENLGFVFGSFGLDSNGDMSVILNGSYLACGNNEKRVLTIMDAIEDMLAKPMRAKSQITGSKAGGTIGPKLGTYKWGDVAFTRFRALSDSSGNPQTIIYDDLAIFINQPTRDRVFKKELTVVDNPHIADSRCAGLHY